MQIYKKTKYIQQECFSQDYVNSTLNLNRLAASNPLNLWDLIYESDS
jgi:hypothetical protein